MKSVGNLTEFVRSHMLEPADATERVRAIVGHFEDLTKAHEAVRRAKDQLAALDPLVAIADRYDDALVRRSALERQRDAVRLYFAELRIALLTGEIAEHSRARERHREAVVATEKERDALSQARDRLIGERAAAGGDRIGELERMAADARRAEEERKERRKRFAAQLFAAQLEPVDDATAFAGLPVVIDEQRGALQRSRRQLVDQHADRLRRRDELQRGSAEIRAELESLASRRNNLPLSHLDIRAQLCRDLRLDAEALPFAGELIDVADGFERWRGAAERVLRGFALSLLVPQRPLSRRRALDERATSHLRPRGRHDPRHALGLRAGSAPARPVAADRRRRASPRRDTGRRAGNLRPLPARPAHPPRRPPVRGEPGRVPGRAARGHHAGAGPLR